MFLLREEPKRDKVGFMPCYVNIKQFSGVAIMLFLFSALSLFASDNYPERGWTVGTSVGVYWGESREIVYNKSKTNTNDYLSLLTWELNPVVTIGIESRWNSGKSGGLDLNLHSAIPGMPTGEMWDYDWETANNPQPSKWSVSDIWMNYGFIFDAGYDWRLISSGVFSLNAGAGYHLDWWAWRDITRDSSYGLPTGVSAINYSVMYHVPLLIVKTAFRGRALYCELSGQIGPVIALGHDHHKLKTENGNVDGLHFYDSAFGGPWMSLEVSGGFHSKRRFSFELKGAYVYLNETKGNSVVVYSDGVTSSELYKDSAGFAFSRISVTALFSWDLFGS